jgi:hypothetical protein
MKSSLKLMKAPHPPYRGYSADVRMQLCINGHVLSIGQLGPDFIILDNPAQHPPADAEIALWIDGRERRWHVHLPEGIVAGKPETKISSGL